MTDLKRIAKETPGFSRCLVVTHYNPDGDAIGSALATALALEEMGKEAVVYDKDPVPKILDFLPGREKFVHEITDTGAFDAVFVVDCGQFNRVGKHIEPLLADHPNIINIDHHRTNESFGRLNMTDYAASSTGELIHRLLTEMKHPISLDVATNLYVAVLTDTGSFQNANSTPEAFEVCARMVRLGVDPAEMSRRVYYTQSFGRLKLNGLVLSTLQSLDGGRIVTMEVTQEMLKSTGTSLDDLEGFVEQLRTIEGAQVGVFFREDAPETYKISMRSKGDIDVSEIANENEGGGHRNAAGCTVRGPLDQVMKKLIESLKERLR